MDTRTVKNAIRVISCGGSLLIAVGYSIDASIAEHFRMGKISITVHEVNTIAQVDKVLLFTYDSKDFSELFNNVIHIPYGYGKTSFIRKITAPITGFIALIKYSNFFKIMRFFGVACPHAALIKKLLGKKLIVSYHYEWAKQACILTNNKFVCILANLIEKFVISQSDVVIALTPTLAKKAKLKGAKKIVIIPNCIPHHFIEEIQNIPKNESKRKLGLPLNKTIILFVGRLAKIKHIDFIIKGFAEIASTRDDIILYIVGDGPERTELEKMVQELSISNKVVFTGFRPIEEVYLYMRAADIFVNASIAEGHPRAVTEALAAGTPVVASRVIGNWDIVLEGVNGFLFEPDNLEDFISKLKLLIDNSDLRMKFGKNAERIIRKNYDCIVTDQKHINIIKSFI